jgi:hypothetical protein
MTVGRAQLQALIRDLGAIPPDVDRGMRQGIRRAAQPALQRIRQNASWSRRIPAATRLSTSNVRAGVTIRVNANQAPHARPYENNGSPSTFRHPVYGNREVWVSQAARPFFYRGIEATADQIRDAIGDVVTDAAKRHGF